MIQVLGDAFIDRYHIGKVRGLSAEAPIPIIDIISTKDFEGGAGNVFENFKSLGVLAQFKDFAPYDNLDEHPIKNRLVTTDGVQLARWDENDYCYPYPPTLCLLATLEGIVISDYAKGSITPEVIEDIINNTTCPLFIDTKRDPKSWLEAYPRVTLFPNLSEYHRYEESYNWFPNVLLKQGPLGMAWMQYGRVIFTEPSHARDIVSVNGAGDTVLAAFVSATLDSQPLRVALEFASVAAAVAISKPFTSTVTIDEMKSYLAR